MEKQIGNALVLPDYPDVSCDSAEYLALRGAYIALIVLVVAGVPAALLLFVWQLHRRGLLNQDTPEEQVCCFRSCFFSMVRI
jgi:hypothetical protein